ncbi:MAG: fibronectin type III domain-containing protein, partial [Vicinamibacterales bacterium]
INLAWTDNAASETGFKIERSTNGSNFTQIAILPANYTSYPNQNLSANTTYTYRVRVYSGPTHSAFSNTAAATTQPPPAAPTNLVANATSTSSITLTWTDNATNEAGFRVERAPVGGRFSQIAILLPNTKTYNNSGLPASTTYSYRVLAYDGPNNSAYSNVATATTQAAPAAPSGLSASAVSTSRINLAWTDNSTNEAGFKLERSTDGTTFTQVATLSANLTSYANTGLAAATTYTYRIRAYEGPNHSAYSNTATATTHAAPAAPTNLAASTLSSSQIRLTWNDNSSNEAGFKLERSTDGTTFSQVATLVANTTAYTNSSLNAATTYIYRIRAYEGTNHSAYSNTAGATTQAAPAAPSNLTATAVSSSRINLAWTDNANNETGFKLERSTDGTTFTQVAILSANVTSYANAYLPASTSYTYRVRAYDGPNHSAFSNTASATTQPTPAAPTNLSATSPSTGKITLTWT